MLIQKGAFKDIKPVEESDFHKMFSAPKQNFKAFQANFDRARKHRLSTIKEVKSGQHIKRRGIPEIFKEETSHLKSNRERSVEANFQMLTKPKGESGNSSLVNYEDKMAKKPLDSPRRAVSINGHKIGILGGDQDLPLQ
jgi:hypothetical protein